MQILKLCCLQLIFCCALDFHPCSCLFCGALQMSGTIVVRKNNDGISEGKADVISRSLMVLELGDVRSFIDSNISLMGVMLSFVHCVVNDNVREVFVV